MREILSDFLSTKAVENKNFYVLSGDHGYALFDQLRRNAPTQFINTGVTEQAMVGCAAGMAKVGKKVTIYGLASFVPMRVLEFIKMNICYEQLPVIILGDGAGTVYTTLGASHQCAEDVACLRTLPIKIFSPADKLEMQACLNQAYQEKGPCYIRIGKCDQPMLHSASSFQLRELISITQTTSKTAIIATGAKVINALNIGKTLGYSVYSCPILSQVREDVIFNEIKKYDSIITIEEHSIHGGLGSMISDIITNNHLGTKLKKFGIEKYFTKGCGSYQYAVKDHALDDESILHRLRSI